MMQRGGIRDRWYKHIGTASLRLAGLRMNSQSAFNAHKQNANCFFQKDEEFYKKSNGTILRLNDEYLKEFVFLKYGNQLSNNRLGFAIQNIKETNPDPCDERSQDDAVKLLFKFSFYYWHVKFYRHITKSSIQPLICGTRNCPGVERIVIDQYREQLPMNSEFAPNSSRGRRFYHYEPESIINVGTCQFNNFSDFIKTNLENKMCEFTQSVA